MIGAVHFVLTNGIRRTIKDAVMHQFESERLARYEAFELFLCDELGRYAVEGLVEKFYRTRKVTDERTD